MTRVIPQIVNTKTALRAAVQALPDTVKIQALLGLDGDCDFSLRSSESYPFRCTKEDLLSLIDRQVQQEMEANLIDNDTVRNASGVPERKAAALWIKTA